MQADVSHLEHASSRFDNEEDESSKSRKRVSRACVRCRLKKDRCDGLRPSCSSCIAAEHACLYEATTKKRGLPEGYVRGLEKLWAILIDKVDGIEDAIVQIMKDHHQDLLTVWNHDTVGEDLHSKWKDSRILSGLEGLLSNLEKDPQTGSKRKRGKDDEDNDSENTKEPETSFLHNPEYRIFDISKPSIVSLHAVGQPQAFQDHGLNMIFPPNATKILDHYFTYTHCWFPILNRPQVLRKFYEYSRRQHVTQISSSDLAVLWALISYTSFQSSEMIDGNVVSGSPRVPDSAAQMQRIARSLIPDERASWDIGHIQASLLLTLIEIGLGHWESAWILLGTAIRSALALKSGIGSPVRRDTTVIQACFLLDTLVAAHLLHPPHLRRSDIHRFGYSEEDGHEEWEPWSSPTGLQDNHHEPAFIISCFNRLFDISVVLNDVITCEVGSDAARMAYFQSRSEILQSLQERFPGTALPSVRSPPHHLYLRLFHRATLITVLRQCFEGGAPAAHLARLSCDILVTLTEHAQKSASELQRIPPVMEHAVRAACYAAIASKPIFGTLPGFPTYLTFARKMTEHISQISSTWPVFSSLSNIWQSALESAMVLREQHPENHEIPSANIGSSIGGFPFLQPGTFETSFPSANWLSTQIAQPINYAASKSYQAQSDSWPELHSGVPSLPIEASDRSLQVAGSPSLTEAGSTHRSSRNHNTFDAQMTGFDNNTPAGLTMPTVESSPSFHGDDLDAIFNNLVQLDTTEWTGDREQGLRDFGFADDITFQAFCNDPERLAEPAAPFGQPPSEIENLWPPEPLQSMANHQSHDTRVSEQVGWWG